MNAAAAAGERTVAVIGRYLRSVWTCLLMMILGLVAIGVWIVVTLCLLTTPIVIGGWALTVIIPGVHWFAGLARQLAGWVLGRPVVGSAPHNRERTLAGRAQSVLADSTTWRLWLWLTLEWVLFLVSAILAVFPAVNTWWCRTQAHLIAGLLGFGSRRAPEPATETPQPGGHGLIGMAERVDMLGGTLRTGPTEDGGFAVRVTIPLPPRHDGES